jgi:hypothetical protein
MNNKNNLNDMILENINVKNLTFIKTKTKSKNNISYIITNNSKKIQIELKNISIPFGIEYFNGKTIVNIEINPNIDNYQYNLYSIISGFELNIQNINFENNKNFSLKNDINNKGYYPNIRESKFGYIVRCYINSSLNIWTTDTLENKMFLSIENIKNTISNVKLELGILWINENNFGIIWYLKDIEIVKIL